MKYKDYSNEIWGRINTTLEAVLKEDSSPIATFDADGTLWDIDLGETFFQYQIDKKLLDLPPAPWEHYLKLKAKNPETAYLWLAQICENHSLEEVRNWSKNALLEQSPFPLFLPQKKLVELFLSKGVQVYIVTASVKWAVEPGAELMGLSKDNVLGVETMIENGAITAHQKGVITYKQGKVEALLAATHGKRPFFCSGNTMGDYELLKSATHLSLAVSAASRDDKLYRTEAELQEHALRSSWLAHRFV